VHSGLVDSKGGNISCIRDLISMELAMKPWFVDRNLEICSFVRGFFWCNILGLSYFLCSCSAAGFFILEKMQDDCRSQIQLQTSEIGAAYLQRR
jgi:hypothetical protein